MDKERQGEITLPLIWTIAATRALAGIGLGLLLSDHLDRGTRRAVGSALLAGGIASTAPLVWRIMAHYHCGQPPAQMA